LLTWWFRIPTSSSHALIGGYGGAAMLNSAMLHGLNAAADPIIASGWIKTLAFIVIAPMLGLGFAHLLMKGTIIVQHRISKKKSET